MKKILFIAIFIFPFLLLLHPSMAEAANRYVRQGATGSTNGTDWTNAYTSLPATLVRGDTYYIADGSYGGWRELKDPESGTLVITIKKATIGDHGTSTGWNSIYGDGQAEIGALKFKYGYYVLDGATGSGSDLSSYGFTSSPFTANPEQHIVISAGQSKTFMGIVIRHTAITCSGPNILYSQMGIFGGTQADIRNPLIQYNFIDNCQVNLYTHGSGWIVENNYFGRAWSGSAQSSLHGIPIQDSYAYGTIFRNNIVIKCTYICIEMGNPWNSGGHAQVYNNIFDPHFGTTQGIVSGSSGWPVLNTVIYDNTIIDSAAAIIYDNGGTGNYIKNNLFYNSHGGTASANASYNSYFNSYSYNTGQAGIQISSSDPFINRASGDYRLALATSAGTPLPSPYNTDYIGVTRAVDGAWDRGAYEYIASGPQPDTTPPSLSNGSPTGQLSAGTTQATLSLTTDENAACKYSLTAGTTYSAMTNTFSTTGALNHSTNVSGLTNGSSYNYYIRCQDVAGNFNATDFPISFSVASGGGSGDNLLLNPDFEGGFTNNLANNWNITTDGSVGYSISQDAGYQGSAQKINISSSGSWGLFYYQTPSFQLNQSYNWSFWYKTQGTGSLWAQITNAPQTQVVHSESLSPTNNQWISKTISFQYANSLANQLRFSSKATSSYWIDNIELAVAPPSQDITPPSAPSGLVVQ